MNDLVPVNEPSDFEFEVGLEIFREAVQKGTVGDIYSIGTTLLQTAWQSSSAIRRRVNLRLFQIFLEEAPAMMTRRPFFLSNRKTSIGLLFANGIATITDVNHRPIITRGSRN